jgi:hypothetical protein
MNWIRRIVPLVGIFLLAVALGTGAAVAADVGTIADAAAETGFYLDRGVSISEDDATAIVSAARNNGSRFHLIVLDDTPPGGNTTLAEAVYDELRLPSGTILVLSPDDVGWISEGEGLTEADLLDAADSAIEAGGSDAEFAANFVLALFGSPVPATTAAPSAAAGDSGGGASGLLWFVVIIVGIGLLLFWLSRRSRKQTVNAAAEQMAKARAAVQKQIDAVANDLLDMEDEVRVANNDEVDQFYNDAGETYREVTERVQAVETPQQLLDISNELDVAIWQLDSAEALLDGKSKPPRPEPKRLEMPPRPDERVTVPAPRPDYQRRQSRRSSYLGPGMMEILIGVAGQVLAGGGRGRGRTGGLGSVFGRSSSSRQSSTPTAKSGGGIIAGPGSTASRPSSTRRSTRSSSSRRSGGRIRGGARRRKK